MYGVCKKVTRTEENSAAIDDLKAQIDAYYAEETKMKDTYTNILKDTGIIVAATVAAALASGATAGASVAAAVILITYTTADLTRQEEKYTDEIEVLVTATNNAATDWNVLFPGENQVGDAEQGFFSSSPGANKDVYEPPDVP
jgi:hypothetical protein